MEIQKKVLTEVNMNIPRYILRDTLSTEMYRCPKNITYCNINMMKISEDINLMIDIRILMYFTYGIHTLL